MPPLIFDFRFAAIRLSLRYCRSEIDGSVVSYQLRLQAGAKVMNKQARQARKSWRPTRQRAPPQEQAAANKEQLLSVIRSRFVRCRVKFCHASDAPPPACVERAALIERADTALLLRDAVAAACYAALMF
jgi:hypothetical protein